MKTQNMEKILNDALEYGRKFIDEGRVATYIPELGKVEKNLLGVSIVDLDGNKYHGGDWDREFTIQSTSKTISLIFALEYFGEEAVFSKVGMEASGDAFNSMVKLETKNKKPANPFINAGAIAIAGLISEKYSFEGFLEFTRKMCRRDTIELDEDVYMSENETGMINRSMAYYMKNSGIIEGDVEKTLEFYFKMCSIKVNTEDLANFGAILANNGRDVQNGLQLVDGEIIRIVKSLMVTCGMYDGSGEFLIRVGMPGKSGVGGGILACAENEMGIGVFGPALDSTATSVGGYYLLEYLSKELGLHCFSRADEN